jgi:AbrB family looped-hinge helix DNA binding protein
MNHQSRIASRSTMTSKGQTTVPKQVRDALGLNEGTQLDWIVKDGQAIVKPRTLRAVDLAGFLGKSPVGPVSIEEMDAAAAAAAVARFERSKR